MRALGICVDPASGNPRIHGVILSGTVRDPVLVEEFELRTLSGDGSEQVVDLARFLLGKIAGLTFEAAVIRTAAPSPVGRRNKAQFSRAHAEGAAIYVLREHLKIPIAAGDPASIAKNLGIKKDEIVLIAKGVSSSKQDAVIAALGGLPID